MYLKNYKTIVIKVGSSLLIDAKKKVRRTWLEKFALDIKDLKNKKKNVIIVSSGAIALGCIIKGQTPHFNFISQAITNSLMDLSVVHKKPIGNGVLTCLNRKQASQRYNKGKEAAKAVLKIISL